MKIAIVGTRGIPNEYGGFEQFAEDFAVRMAAKGHQMTVYTSHNHSYSQKSFRGVELIHCFDPEFRIGTAGQFIYDFNCIRDSRRRGFDLILQLGYTSSTIWSWLFPKSAVLVTNMDGLEWRRSKYRPAVQRFLRQAEKWAVRYSDYLVADSRGIQQYVATKYQVPSVFVPYGAECYQPAEGAALLADYGLQARTYDLVIARFESENNIEMVLQAFAGLPGRTLVLIGKYDLTPFGRKMFAAYGELPNIRFLGGIFDKDRLNVLRYHSELYFHGHSVGGTNPSLLEAMACGALICAHDNEFNRAVLQDNAYYFSSATGVADLTAAYGSRARHAAWQDANLAAIRDTYSWDGITTQLEQYFEEWLKP